MTVNPTAFCSAVIEYGAINQGGGRMRTPNPTAFCSTVIGYGGVGNGGRRIPTTVNPAAKISTTIGDLYVRNSGGMNVIKKENIIRIFCI